MKLNSVFSIVFGFMILSIGTSEILEFKEADSRIQTFQKDSFYQIYVEDSSKFEEILFHVSAINSEELCIFKKEPTFYYGYENIICQAFDLKQISLYEALILKPNKTCKTKINIFAFQKDPKNKTVLKTVLPIPLKIGEIEFGFLPKNHEIFYSFSSGQSNERNVITIVMRYMSDRFTPFLEVSCKNSDQCLTQKKQPKLKGIYSILEIDNAKGDFILKITREESAEIATNESKEGYDSYSLLIYESVSKFELKQSTTNFYLGKNRQLQISNFQAKNKNEINMFQISQCKGNLKIIPLNYSIGHFRMVGQNIWIINSNQQFVNLFETQEQSSFVRIKQIKDHSTQEILEGINSSLEFSAKPSDEDGIKVIIQPITFDEYKLPDWRNYKIQFTIFIYENQIESSLDTECKEIDAKFPYPDPIRNETIHQQEPNLISYHLQMNPRKSIKVIGNIETDLKKLNEKIVLNEKKESENQDGEG